MNCFNCGEEVPEGQNFCGNCGAPQNADPGLKPFDGPDDSGSRSGSLTWLWILLGCGGLILISCCLASVLLFTLSGAISQSASSVLEQVTTIEPELLDDPLTELATLLPEDTPAPSETAVAKPTAEFTCGNLGITTSSWMQVDVVCEEVPAHTDTGFMVTPDSMRMTFIDYPVSPSFHKPQISIFPVDDYRQLSSEASDRIDQLQDLLENKPDKPQQPYPFLPLWNAAQSIAVQYKYVEFMDGEGIRYLTQYGQAAWPINNRDLFYTFQGLTSDGKYYLSAVLPVTNPDLPPDGDSYIGEDFESFIDTYTDYLTGVKRQLEQSSSKAYNPKLTDLDGMMQELSVR
ncbi:MAG: zinc ribbon domain-containing protein [Anaerolineales bacterium]|jgi:hypothetical protein